MVLRLRQREREEKILLDWALPPRSYFIESEAFRIFRKALDRYVGGEVPGNCFLISGHRGAGKTSLVLRAVHDNAEAAFEDLRKLAEALTEESTSALRRKGLRRALLVKLHGPSLVAPQSEKAQAGAAPAQAEEKPGSTGQEVDALAAGALKQITIALYRALSDEYARCFANQAAKPDDERLVDRLYELAAQFRLDLDQGADQAAMRDYWDAVGCLRRGVLWPRRLGEAALEAGIRDQGMREILAIVTAAQAFQVCLGAVKYSHTEKGADRDEQVRDSKLGLDLGGLSSRLLGVIGGGLVGWSAGDAVGAAAGAGLAATISSVWSSRQTRNQEQSTDYTFIRDFDLQTLDRDLPLVITRIREAGLAPVFVIDELDKIDKPEQIIADLIRRLKHLTTDYGFFCFLTGRGYYEYIERQLTEKAYPPEHSFFSDRLFILYTPNELVDYLDRVIVMDPPDPGGERDDRVARLMLGRIVLHRSKLNTVAMMRELTRGWTEDGQLIERSEALVSNVGNQLIVTVQLAIESVLASPRYVEILRHDPMFHQLAIDAVYQLSRSWEADAKKPFDSAKVAVATCLAKRLDPPPDGDQALATLGDRFGGMRVHDLIFVPPTLISLLADFSLLHQILGKDSVPAGIIPTGPAGLMKPDTKKASVHQFVYDLHGRALDPGAFNAQGGPSEQTQERVQAWNEMIETFETALEEVKIDGSDLVAAGLLPSTVSFEVVDQARRRAMSVIFRPGLADTLSADLPILESFAAALRASGPSIGAAIPLLMRLRSFVPSVTVQTLIARIAPFGALAELAEAGYARPSQPATPSDDEGRNRLWQNALEEYRQDLARDEPMDLYQVADAAWSAWGKSVADYLTRGQALAPITLEDLILATAGSWPTRLFRRDLSAMTAVEWSRLCLHGADSAAGGDGRVPAWACFAALVALRFGPAALRMVAERLDGNVSGTALLPPFEEFVPPAISTLFLGKSEITQADRGRLLITSAGDLPSMRSPADIKLRMRGPSGLEGEPAQPYIVVTVEVLPMFDRALNWLSPGVIVEVFDEFRAG